MGVLCRMAVTAPSPHASQYVRNKVLQNPRSGKRNSLQASAGSLGITDPLGAKQEIHLSPVRAVIKGSTEHPLQRLHVSVSHELLQLQHSVRK